jgi:hypothetical protein
LDFRPADSAVRGGAARAGDLIEERRRFRVVLVLSSAIFIAAVIVLEIFMDGPPATAPLSIVNAAGVLALTAAFVAAQLSPARSPSASPGQSRWQRRRRARRRRPTRRSRRWSSDCATAPADGGR